MKTVEDSPKIGLFLEYFTSKFCPRADKGKRRVGMKKWKEFRSRLESKDEKSSSEENKKTLLDYQRALRKDLKQVQAEKPSGVDVQARVKDGILLRILTKKNGFEPHVNAEIRARNIEMTAAQEKDWTIAEKRKKLRIDEAERWKRDPSRSGGNIEEKDIKFINPISEEMKGLFNAQTTILNKEAGIDELEASVA